MNLFVYWEYTNGSVRMYREYAEFIKVNYLSKFKTKIENILGLLSEAQMGLFGQTLFKSKNLVQVYLWA
jgi:hypothetical protein